MKQLYMIGKFYVPKTEEKQKAKINNTHELPDSVTKIDSKNTHTQ